MENKSIEAPVSTWARKNEKLKDKWDTKISQEVVTFEDYKRTLESENWDRFCLEFFQFSEFLLSLHLLVSSVIRFLVVIFPASFLFPFEYLEFIPVEERRFCTD